MSKRRHSPQGRAAVAEALARPKRLTKAERPRTWWRCTGSRSTARIETAEGGAAIRTPGADAATPNGKRRGHRQIVQDVLSRHVRLPALRQLVGIGPWRYGPLPLWQRRRGRRGRRSPSVW
jgi:hypothetical protein